MAMINYFSKDSMDFLKYQVSIGVVLAALALVLAAYFTFRWFTRETSGFADVGEECNPQIENPCGDKAKCHPDETGERGICFPKEEATENVDAE
jgi:hypothetical protein